MFDKKFVDSEFEIDETIWWVHQLSSSTELFSVLQKFENYQGDPCENAVSCLSSY